MLTESIFNFKVSLSTDAYKDKVISGAMIGTTKEAKNREIRKNYGYKANKGIGYKEVEVNAETLLENLINGHVFCHLFNPTTTRKDGTFGSSQKKDDNFSGSYCIGVDIDETQYKTISDYINTLEYKPTFWYSSYSNKADKPKFRMVYVFSEYITGKYFFRYCAWQLNKKIETDTKELITDDCNLRCAQYFNGTNVSNPDLTVEYGLTNNVYSFSDFGINEADYTDFLRNDCYYKSKSKERQSEITSILSYYSTISSNSYSYTTTTTTYYNDLEKSVPPSYTVYEPISEESITVSSDNSFEIDKTLLSDMGRLEYDEFMKYNRHKYEYFYRVESYEWVDCDSFSYAVIDDNYFSLYWNVNTIKDGSNRRKKIYQRMCLRRLIKPSVTPEELAFNAYEDIARFVDNSDNLLGADYIKKNVERAFQLSLEDIKETYSENIDYLKSKAPKRGKIYRFKGLSVSSRSSLIRDVNMTEIMGYYDTSKTVEENLEYLNSYGFSVCKQTLYNYLNKLGVSTKDAIQIKKENREDFIKTLLTPENCSKRKFREVLKANGISLAESDLRRIIKEYKNYTI